jgi:hypothetical protein
VLAAAASDSTVSVESRVRLVLAWLAAGIIPDKYRRAPLERAAKLLAALRMGEVLIDTTLAAGRLAEVVTEEQGAIQLGYRFAPVVVAQNPRHRFADGSVGSKYTIAQYALGYADLDKALGTILALEAGWGGSPTIKGSPQGRPSLLNRATVARAVAESLRDAGCHERS